MAWTSSTRSRRPRPAAPTSRSNRRRLSASSSPSSSGLTRLATDQRRRSALRVLCLAPAKSVARAPEADQAGDEGDEEDLAEHHLQPGDHPAGLTAGDEVAVAGRGQRRVAEEEEVAALGMEDAFEDGAALDPVDHPVEEGEEDAEHGV